MEINWANILIFCGLSIGHVAFVVAIVNRVHGLRLPLPLLHRLRQFHDLVIVIFPALFVWFYGVHGPALFRVAGPVWHRLPTAVLAYLAVCGVIAISLPLIAVYRVLRNPSNRISQQSQTIDVAVELGFRPLGRGPYQLFTCLPGNQFLKLEVSDHEYWLPRLPQEWDGLSILHLSDLHFTGAIDRPFFEYVTCVAQGLPADLVVFTGDLLDREDLIDWLPATLGKLNAPLGCYFVLGNHDSYMKDPDEIRGRLENLGWHDATGPSKVIEYRGRQLAICGSELPWMGCQPDMTSTPADAFRLFLSHTPDNIQWARQHRIDLMLAGHNHGGQVRLPLFGPIYSPSTYGAHFASGAFWEDPTLMYVSRGISGRHPLRWNCLPELTRLTLRCAVAARSAAPAAIAVVAN
jgi:predicted MPP superfamily phosphohydrolase